MRQDVIADGGNGDVVQKLLTYGANFPKRSVIGIILMVALFAFEMFNFDTTRYALSNLLGPVSFARLGWATILAIAFCSIDFAGLVRLFTSGDDGQPSREAWFLMGAWFLGATMNALMTWWAVSLTLLNHDFGNEVLSRGQLLQIVPIFVAVLVWLTRILFIGALTVAGGHLLEFATDDVAAVAGQRSLRAQPTAAPRERRRPLHGNGVTAHPAAHVTGQRIPHTSDDVPAFLDNRRRQEEAPAPRHAARREVVEEEEAPPLPKASQQRRTRKPNGRVRQRPPIPGTRSSSISARSRGRS